MISSFKIIKAFFSDAYLSGYYKEFNEGQILFLNKSQEWEEGFAKWKSGNDRWNAGRLRADNATIQLAARYEEHKNKTVEVEKLREMKANGALSFQDEMELESLEFMLPVMWKGLEDRKANLTIALNMLSSSRKQLDEGKMKLDDGEIKLKEGKEKLNAASKKLENVKTMLWTLTTAVFVIGGIIGAFTSKFAAEGFGRKKSIIFHYSFGIVAGVLTILSIYIRSPICVIVGRFLFGVQGGKYI